MSAVVFDCPKCAATNLEFGLDAIGKTVRCPECGGQTRVPGARSSPLLIWLTIGLGASTTFLATALIVVLFLGGGWTVETSAKSAAMIPSSQWTASSEARPPSRPHENVQAAPDSPPSDALTPKAFLAQLPKVDTVVEGTCKLAHIFPGSGQGDGVITTHDAAAAGTLMRQRAYNGSYFQEGSYYCVLFDNGLIAYAGKNSAQGKAVFAALKDGEWHRLRLTMRYVNFPDAGVIVTGVSP